MLNVLHGFIVFQEVYIMTTTSRPALITRIWSFSVLNSNTHFLKSRNNNKLDYFCRPRLSQLEGNQGIFQKRKPLFVILRQFSSRKTIFNILMQISSYFEDHTLLSLLSILSFTLCFTEKKWSFKPMFFMLLANQFVPFILVTVQGYLRHYFAFDRQWR